MSSPFYHLQGLLGDDVTLLDSTIRESFQSHQYLIPQISRYLIDSGGKRLRPFLALGFAKMFNNNDPRRFYQAASLEFLHTATLLHDDIIDNSNQRRGKASAHTLWGNEATVLVGDFLFAQAFSMMVKLRDQRVLDILANTATRIAEGEVMQLAHAHNLEVSDQEYITMISSKTSILFQAACETAALLSGQSTEIACKCGQYGLNLGIAFQLADDVLDYMDAHDNLGKNIGDDFAEGKISAPALYSYRQGNTEIRNFWQDAVQGNRDIKQFNKAKEIMAKQQVIPDILQRAREYAYKAIIALEKLPQKTTITSVLASCALYAATRQY